MKSFFCLAGVLAGVLAALLWAAPAAAFHDGGVAECAGCHTMHNSQNGTAVDAEHPQGNTYLLNRGSPSDTCLRCHAAYGQYADGAGFGPGGDFGWLQKTFTWAAHGHLQSSPGDSHGHNVVAPAYGLTADVALTRAPGGTFQAAFLGCTSCHDPHGNLEFRLLYGADSGPAYAGGRFDFVAAAPLAKSNSRRTVAPEGFETDRQHTIHKSGMSDWCANCHPDFHSDNSTAFRHPVGELGATIAAHYNAYLNTGDVVGGSSASAYRGLVPFEAVNIDLTTVDSTNHTAGPSGSDQVMCLTCHRAHASAYADAARWDMTETFLADSHPNAGDVDFLPSDVERKDYLYTFVPAQRSLCNKCHVKDFGDLTTTTGSLPNPVSRGKGGKIAAQWQD